MVEWQEELRRDLGHSPGSQPLFEKAAVTKIRQALYYCSFLYDNSELQVYALGDLFIAAVTAETKRQAA
jgi:hypothetical protein